MVGWIKMKLGMQVGLGPGHIVLHGDPAPRPPKADGELGPHDPPISGPYLLWINGCIDQDATWYGGRPRRRRLCVRWGPCSPSPKKGRSAWFSAHVCCGQTAAWIKMALGIEVGLSPGDFVLDGDPAARPQKGGRCALPNFRPISIVAELLDASLTS